MLPDRGLPPLQKRALKVIHSFRVLHTEVQIVDFLGLSRLESRGSLLGVADLHSTIDVRCLMILDDALDSALAEVSASGSW